MPYFKVDWENWHNFHVKLGENIQYIGNDRRSLSKNLEEAKAYWHDEEYAKYAARIIANLEALERFEGKARNFVEWMKKREQMAVNKPR